MNKHLFIFVAIALVLTLTGQVFASGEGAATLYNQGNALYAQGDYDGALRSYRHALEQRVADPQLEQNIGSAYLKLGDIGMAVYHFERGLLLAPRDADLRHNLEFATSLRQDETPDDGALFVSKLYEEAINSFTSGEFAAALLALFLLLFAVLFVLIFVQGRARPALFISAASLFVLLAFVSIFAFGRFYQDHFVKRGVVVVKTAVAQTGPGNNQKEAFTLHGGTNCTLLERRGNWVKIKVTGDFSGWVKAGNVRAVAFD